MREGHCRRLPRGDDGRATWTRRPTGCRRRRRSSSAIGCSRSGPTGRATGEHGTTPRTTPAARSPRWWAWTPTPSPRDPQRPASSAPWPHACPTTPMSSWRGATSRRCCTPSSSSPPAGSTCVRSRSRRWPTRWRPRRPSSPGAQFSPRTAASRTSTRSSKRPVGSGRSQSSTPPRPSHGSRSRSNGWTPRSGACESLCFTRHGLHRGLATILRLCVPHAAGWFAAPVVYGEVYGPPLRLATTHAASTPRRPGGVVGAVTTLDVLRGIGVEAMHASMSRWPTSCGKPWSCRRPVQPSSGSSGPTGPRAVACRGGIKGATQPDSCRLSFHVYDDREDVGRRPRRARGPGPSRRELGPAGLARC